MISKKTPMRAKAKGKIGHLLSYLLDKKGKDDRVDRVRVTNCESGDPKWAAYEMQAVQERNQRAKGDKTYHLVISFRAGEEPSPDALEKIEAEFARELGFAEHQRVSVIHRDTDNLHLHVAVNKVHPGRFTFHEPYNDYHTRQKLCERLEQHYGLVSDQLKTRRDSPAHEKAATMEIVAGVESLVGYVQRSLRTATLAARSWEEIHEAFNKAGVSLKPRGNGLVVESGGQTAKASSCFRELSRVALERRLGAFQSPGANEAEARPADGYRARPVQKAKSGLYNQYQIERRDAKDQRAVGFERAYEAHQRRVKRTKAAFQTQLAIIRLTRRGTVNRIMLQFHRANLRIKLDASHRTYKTERNATYRASKLMAWNDWLMEKAASGNPDALSALRARRVGGALAAKAVGLAAASSPHRPTPKGGQGTTPYVTRGGTLRGILAGATELARKAKEWTNGR